MSTAAALQPAVASVTQSTSVLRLGLGSPQADPATLAASGYVYRETESANLTAAEATTACSGLVIHQSSVALPASEATTAASVQVAYDTQVSLEAAFPGLFGEVDRVVFSTVSLTASPALGVGTSGVVQPPSANYNITVSNQNYVVYAILD
jgi:hypothetical protein